MRLKTICAVVMIVGFSMFAVAQKAPDLYEQALVQERAVGNLGKAIELFQEAAKEAGTDRELAAKALMGAARCYEKIGEANAVLLYQQVSQNYADQAAQASQARERLTALQRTRPSTGTPPAVEALQAQLRDLGKMLDRLSPMYTPQHPEIRKLRDDLLQLQRLVEFERLNPSEADKQAAWDVLQKQVESRVNAWQQFEGSSQFDMSRPVTFTGTVKRVDFVNPNVWIHVDVKEPNGTIVDHAIKGCSPSALVQSGWKRDTLKTGDIVTVEGLAAKDGSNVVGVATFTLPDGRRLFAGWGTLPCIPPR